MKTYVIPVQPVPAPRQVRSDKWAPAPRVQRYRAFCNELKFVTASSDLEGRIREAKHFHVAFYMPMPESWSGHVKTSFHEQPHKTKPDVDNLLKAFLDALFENDSFISSVTIAKYWINGKGRIVVQIPSEAV